MLTSVVIVGALCGSSEIEISVETAVSSESGSELTNDSHLLIFLTDNKTGAGDLTSVDARAPEVDFLQHNLRWLTGPKL